MVVSSRWVVPSGKVSFHGETINSPSRWLKAGEGHDVSDEPREHGRWTAGGASTDTEYKISDKQIAVQSVATDAVKASAVTPENKKLYASEIKATLGRMNDHCLERIAQNLKSYRFFNSNREVTDDEAAHDPKAAQLIKDHPDALIEGLYSPKNLSVVFDGATPDGEPPRDTYAHEYYHAVDGPKCDYSNDQAWLDAGNKELTGGQLSNYATESQREGFAEFGRMLCSKQMDRAPVRKAFERYFPLCFAFFKDHDLLPKAFTKKEKAPAAKSADNETYTVNELFTDCLVTDDGTIYDIRDPNHVGGNKPQTIWKDFDPDKHPRAADGKFGSGDGTAQDKDKAAGYTPAKSLDEAESWARSKGIEPHWSLESCDYAMTLPQINECHQALDGLTKEYPEVKIDDVGTFYKMDLDKWNRNFALNLQKDKEEMEGRGKRWYEAAARKRVEKSMIPKPTLDVGDKDPYYNYSIFRAGELVHDGKRDGADTTDRVQLRVNQKAVVIVSPEKDEQNRQKTFQRAKDGKDTGATMANVSECYHGVIVHEFGHAVDDKFDISDDPRMRALWAEYSGSEEKKAKCEKELSSYAAGENIKEFVAEGFDEYHHKDCRPLGTRIGKVIDEIVAEKRKGNANDNHAEAKSVSQVRAVSGHRTTRWYRADGAAGVRSVRPDTGRDHFQRRESHETISWRRRLDVQGKRVSEWLKDFDEDRHPRDNHGRWTAGGVNQEPAEEGSTPKPSKPARPMADYEGFGGAIRSMPRELPKWGANDEASLRQKSVYAGVRAAVDQLCPLGGKGHDSGICVEPKDRLVSGAAAMSKDNRLITIGEPMAQAYAEAIKKHPADWTYDDAAAVEGVIHETIHGFGASGYHQGGHERDFCEEGSTETLAREATLKILRDANGSQEVMDKMKVHGPYQPQVETMRIIAKECGVDPVWLAEEFKKAPDDEGRHNQRTDVMGALLGADKTAGSASLTGNDFASQIGFGFLHHIGGATELDCIVSGYDTMNDGMKQHYATMVRGYQKVATLPKESRDAMEKAISDANSGFSHIDWSSTCETIKHMRDSLKEARSQLKKIGEPRTQWEIDQTAKCKALVAACGPLLRDKNVKEAFYIKR